MFRKSNRTSFVTIIIIMIITFVLVSSGCSQKYKQLSNVADDTVRTSYPFIFKDDSGADVIINSKPLRIVSLLPSSTETLFALGQEADIIAVSKWDNYPEQIKDYNFYVFEDSLNPSLEKLNSLKPDLILIGSLSGDTLRKMRSLQLPIVVFNPQSLEKTYETIRKISQITDTQKQAAYMIDKMQDKEKKIKETVAKINENEKVRVWMEVSKDLYSPGRNTFLNELITKAGGKNISTELEGWVQLTADQVADKNPQVILYTYGQYEKNAKSIINTRPKWSSIDAVKNNKIYEMDSDLISRPGPRIIDGLELIAKSLYPDRF